MTIKTMKLLPENLKLAVTENHKVWLLIAGIGVAGIAAVTITVKRRRDSNNNLLEMKDFGAFVDRFVLLPFPPPPPPAAPLPLVGLTFAVEDIFEIQGRVTGFGSKVWKKTHEEGGTTAMVITSLMKKGATFVGSTVLDQFSIGITGENADYGTPINPLTPQYIPGGSSSGSAVAVAAQLAEFALGIDTTGGVRIPAAYCGVFGFRASHRAVSMVGVLPNSQSLDTIGWFARDPSILRRVGHVLLQCNSQARRSPRFLFAVDLFEFSEIPKHKTLHAVSKAIESLSGYQSPKHVNVGQFITSNVPSLVGFSEDSATGKNGVTVLKTLASVMDVLNRYEFKTNHQDWFASVKLQPDVSERAAKASDSILDNLKNIYKLKSELLSALQTLLKEDGILVLPTIADPPLKRNSRKGLLAEFYDRALLLSSLSSMSGCCQVAVPLGEYNGFPISVSFIASHGADMFLLDTILDCYSSLRHQASLASESLPSTYANDDDEMEAAELLKEKGNAAYKGKQWNKAVNYYTEAIKMNGTNATYYSNRAAAYLELACFQKAEGDCTKAVSLDKKNVKAYLRRGTSRESLLRYKEANEDFKHALVLEPQNKVASVAVKRLRKLLS